MELNVTPEDIEKMAKDYITKAVLGKTIQESITKALSGYHSPVDQAVAEVIRKMLVDILSTDHKATLMAAVNEAIKKRLTGEMIDKFTDDVMSRLERAARENY